jgi:arylsulfatase A-like enzyme
MSRKQNVLFITCDQWRGDSLSAVGHKVVKTPNTDALAAEGVLFARHYAGAAPCSPARACLYTGRYQMTNRVCRNGSPMDARFTNLAKEARAAGYDPTLFGYTDVAPDPRTLAQGDPHLRSYEGVLPGFTPRVLLPEHQKPWLSWLRARGVDTGSGYPDIHRPAGGATDGVTRTPPVYGADETPTAFLTDEFLRWLGEQDDDRPWFAHLSYISPHPPFVVPAPFNELYDEAACGGSSRLDTWELEAATHPWIAHELERQMCRKFRPGAQGRVRDWTEADFRRLKAIYLGMITEVDAQLGRIWSALKAAGIWDDTIVLLTSDHAEMMGDHYMLGKGGFFDGSFHIPLIVRAPRAGATGLRIDGPTEAVDVLPTLLELVGAPSPPHLDGRSLVPFLTGAPPATWRDAAHWEFDFRGLPGESPFGLDARRCNLSVLRTARWKYVHFNGGLPPLLYDLEDDPGERVDRAQDPACRSARLECAERLLDWRASHLDQELAFLSLEDDGVVPLV